MANPALNPVGLVVDPVSEKLAPSPVVLDRQSCLDSLATFAGQRMRFGGMDSCLLLDWEKSYLTGSRRGQKGWCLLGLVGVVGVAGVAEAVVHFVAVEVVGMIGAFGRGRMDCFEETRRELRIEVVKART